MWPWKTRPGTQNRVQPGEISAETGIRGTEIVAKIFGNVRERRSGTDAGFSLIEILVVAGLMGVVSIGVVSISKIGFMGQKTIQAQDDARVVTDNVANILTNPSACLNTLGGLNPVTTGPGATVTNIKDQNNSTQYTVGSKYGNKSLQLADMAIGGGTNIDAKSKTQKWISTGGNSGTAFLSLHWTQTGTVATGVSGPKDLYRFVLVNATVNGSNQITGCSAVVANVSSSGTGAANYIPLWTTSLNLGNSSLYQSSGNIGIGTTAPVAALDVHGGIRAGASTVVTSPCGSGAANGEGTQRYNYSTHNMEYCNGSGWVAVGGSSGAAGISMVGSTSSVAWTTIGVGIYSNTLLSYNPGTSAFSAPSDGNYFFTAYSATCYGGYSGVSGAEFTVNGSVIGWEYNASNCNTGSFSAFYYMHAGDSVQGLCSQNAGMSATCYFSVVKL